MSTDLFKTFDKKYVAYLLMKGYSIDSFHWIKNKNGKDMICFVFYENPTILNNEIRDYIQSEIARFNHYETELTNLIRQTKTMPTDEFLKSANSIY
jgi:hypothetical protein